MIEGTLKANQLVLGRLTVDWLRSPMHLTALAGLTNKETGQTHGWVDGGGIQWSKETAAALAALRLAVEHDLARAHLTNINSIDKPTGLDLGGIAEHFGAGADDAPSV